MDLRARVGLRRKLSEQRDGRWWLAAQPSPEAAREGVTVAPAVIDVLDVQIALVEKQRFCARRRAGCRAPMVHYGVGPLVAVTILAELGDCTRFSSSRRVVRCAGMDITPHQSDQRRSPEPRPRLLRAGGRPARW